MAPDNTWAAKYLQSDHHSDRELHNKVDYVYQGRGHHPKDTVSSPVRHVSASMINPWSPDDVTVLIHDDVEPDINIPKAKYHAQDSYYRPSHTLHYTTPQPVRKSAMTIQLSHPRISEYESSYYGQGAYSMVRGAGPQNGYQPSTYGGSRRGSIVSGSYPTNSYSKEEDPVMVYYRRRSIAPGTSAYDASFQHRRPSIVGSSSSNYELGPSVSETLAHHRPVRVPRQHYAPSQLVYGRRPSVTEHRPGVSHPPVYSRRPSLVGSQPSNTAYVAADYSHTLRRPSISDPCLATTRRPSVTILQSSVASSTPSRTYQTSQYSQLSRPRSRPPSIDRTYAAQSLSGQPSYSATHLPYSARSRQSSPMCVLDSSRRSVSRAGSVFSSSRYPGSRGPSLSRT